MHSIYSVQSAPQNFLFIYFYHLKMDVNITIFPAKWSCTSGVNADDIAETAEYFKRRIPSRRTPRQRSYGPVDKK